MFSGRQPATANQHIRSKNKNKNNNKNKNKNKQRTAATVATTKKKGKSGNDNKCLVSWVTETPGIWGRVLVVAVHGARW